MKAHTTGFLSSRVARRVFLLFLFCALAPLLLFAWLALDNVTAQLEDQAGARLQEACKSAGMTVVERIGHVHNDLRLAIRRSPTKDLQGLREGSREFRKHLEDRFDWLATGTADELGDAERTLSPLTAEERKHLEKNPGLLRFQSANGKANVVVVMLLQNGPVPRYLYGSIRASYLWGGDGLLRPNVDLLVVTEAGDQLYSTRPAPGLRAKVAAALHSEPARGNLAWEHRGSPQMACYRTMFTRPQFFSNFVLAYSQSRDSVLAPVSTFKNLFVLFSVLTLGVVVLASLVQIRRSMVPITVLAEATEKVRNHDLSARVSIDTNDEFHDLGESFNRMAGSLGKHVETMDTLHHIGVALTAEKSSDALIQTIAQGAHQVTSAELLLLHLTDKRSQLQVAHLSTRSNQRLRFGINLSQTAAVTKAVATGRTVVIDDVDNSNEFDATHYQELEGKLGYRFRSVLCVPMKNHDDEVIGVLELVNAKNQDTGKIQAFSREERRVAESLGSQAGVAITKNRLVDEFRNLFDSLSELLAKAIDEKSQYTGDHCRRVPILTMMIAQEACEAEHGSFAAFTPTEDELYELKVAALLHDCGKVTTPVHVVDKATKLETIYDRINTVDTRFEVVRRDLKIAHLERLLADAAVDGTALEQSEQVLRKQIEELEQERDFLRHSNVGGEYMNPEAQAKVGEIAAKYEWRSTDGERQPFLSKDEIENLCISRGTLNSMEREIVNYHVTATIKMLEGLPYPKQLARVPEIAGAHHEKMDGTGYPYGLKRHQISMQGRILGIADVFEALTAKDRPYKPGKTLTETLSILGRMKENGHIDPDLFQLFIDSRVYLRYAKEFLDVEQIDDVDLTSIPGYELPQTASAVS